MPDDRLESRRIGTRHQDRRVWKGHLRTIVGYLEPCLRLGSGVVVVVVFGWPLMKWSRTMMTLLVDIVEGQVLFSSTRFNVRRSYDTNFVGGLCSRNLNQVSQRRISVDEGRDGEFAAAKGWSRSHFGGIAREGQMVT
ncbi:uncharacterized protein K489DRAFT_214978 [Dissoconium aciculare CBS 342.82]|uniref:Uncharacterized protein n=1 Tax=Dissoconium aciculare CBS 342.82 TaxID=1314786 RepID=A0A6J3M5A9_9PEZI|nr:uncharacterized protein K489DRAFT_214978 [Dissoconium aciculare CBS 342.82]KAF1822709.1 hypothetical protein K489DRAFT_214978 [Dissoconium aciculare CBS 342.82]